MTKYHIKKDGSPGKCNAKKGNCPFGENTPHFESVEAAQHFADLKNRIEIEEDLGLTTEGIYSLNNQEADSLANSIEETVQKMDKEIQEMDNQIEELEKTEDYIEYKELEKLYEAAKRERIKVYNNKEDEEESYELMKEDIESVVGVHEFRDGDYVIEISSENYWIKKPKYKGYKINEDGTREQMVLPKMPPEVVQKAFKSKENKDAFSEIKKASNINSRYAAHPEDRINAYPPTEYNKKLESAKAEEEKALEEYNKKKDSEVVKKIDSLEEENRGRRKSREKLQSQGDDIIHAQNEIRRFHELGGNITKDHTGQPSNDDDKILVRAREQGIEQPVRYIMQEDFRARMADSWSQTRREQEELERRYSPILRKYGLDYWNGSLKLLD